ncbi:FadR/GntR family transcriptional regulator [Aestuariirhabdus sp. LZHN29]|uniref:FadR/GntR family transcriptional regulator n=1 Tax=Aestuariirhabdus sp. LZHN29 TaxID=3417462 RepID=UPI003CE86F9A
MAISNTRVVTQSLAKQIANSIRDSIAQGELVVDERLPTEEELSVQFGVSRPTIREALKRLAAQNLIRSQRGPTGGTFVKRPSLEEMRDALCSATTLMVGLGAFRLQEIAEARHQMERLCCELSVHNIDNTQLGLMEEALEKQQQAITDEEFCQFDVQFHRALVDGCGNNLLQFNMFTMIEALQPVSNMVISRFRDRAPIIEAHRAILDGLLNRNGADALEALDRLMAYLKGRYEEAQEWKSKQQKQRSPQ